MTATPAMRLWFTPSQAGIEIGCSAAMVLRMIHHDEIRAERRGTHFKICRAEVERVAGHKLTAPEGEEREAKVRELRKVLAEAQRILAELE